MAMAKPVIATCESTRSLAVENGNELWIANDPARFAEAVISTLKTAGDSSVAANGRRYVEQHHDWRQILADFDRRLDALQGPTGVEPRPATVAANLRHATLEAAK